MIARELHWSLGEVIYGKKVIYDNGKGISDFERDLWFSLWMIEKEERDEEEAKQKKAQAKAQREQERRKGR